jgi:hypothetical protein
MTTPPTNPFTHHQLPGEIMNHWVWLYNRFWLSAREAMVSKTRAAG